MIGGLRKDIDGINQKILLLIKQRNDIAKNIGEYKKDNDLPIQDTTRESAMLEDIEKEAANLGLEKKQVRKIFNEIIKLSKEVQK